MKTGWPAACLFIFLSLGIVGAAIASDIGFFTDNVPGCRIKRQEKDQDCLINVRIFPGDLLSTREKPERLKIQWLSPESVRFKEEVNHTYFVVFTPPRDANGLLQIVRDMLGFTRSTPHTMATLASRGFTGGRQPGVRPDAGSTLFPGTKTLFECSLGKRNEILKIEAGGVTVFTTALDEDGQVRFSPEEAGLRAGGAYVWSVLEAFCDNVAVRVLSREVSDLLTDLLARIDHDATLSDTDRLLSKAALLKFYSDTYPDQARLYWLAVELVERGNLSKEALRRARHLTSPD